MINYLTLTGEGYCLTFRLEVLYVSQGSQVGQDSQGEKTFNLETQSSKRRYAVENSYLTISVQFDLIFDKKGMLSNKTKKCKI